MIRRSSAPNHLRGQLNQSKRTGTGGAAVVSDLERQYFEFDRKIVAEVLDTLRNAIAEGATQMAMVADERMFDRSLSGTFSRTALHLDRMGGRLEKLLGEVGQASGYPKLAVERPAKTGVLRRLPDR
jgi:hypothetical protein